MLSPLTRVRACPQMLVMEVDVMKAKISSMSTTLNENRLAAKKTKDELAYNLREKGELNNTLMFMDIENKKLRWMIHVQHGRKPSACPGCMGGPPSGSVCPACAAIFFEMPEWRTDDFPRTAMHAAVEPVAGA